MLDLHKLAIFVAAAHEGSFSGAAERQFLTQAAVSQHMNELEIQLGVTLFVRGRRGVKLTAKGETLLSYAERLLRLAAEAETAVTDIAQIVGGQLSIGATPGASVYLLPECIQAFRAAFPNITVQLQTAITSMTLAALRTRQIQLAVIEGELDDAKEDRLEIVILEEAEQFVVVGPKHPWWDKHALQLNALDGAALIARPANSHSRIWLERVFAEHRVRPTINAEFDNVESIKRAVSSGQCATILPGYVVEYELGLGLLRALAISGRPLVRTVKLVWERTEPLSPIAEAFADHVKQRFAAQPQFP